MAQENRPFDELSVGENSETGSDLEVVSVRTAEGVLDRSPQGLPRRAGDGYLHNGSEQDLKVVKIEELPNNPNNKITFLI